MNLQFRVELELGDAAKVFPQNGGFDLELMLIAGVLVVAATAASEVRASRLDALWRRRDNLLSPDTRKARFLFEQDRIDPFAFEDKRHEGSLAATAFVRGQTGQSVAAVNQLLNGEFQGLILQTRS